MRTEVMSKHCDLRPNVQARWRESPHRVAPRHAPSLDYFVSFLCHQVRLVLPFFAQALFVIRFTAVNEPVRDFQSHPVVHLLTDRLGHFNPSPSLPPVE